MKAISRGIYLITAVAALLPEDEGGGEDSVLDGAVGAGWTGADWLGAGLLGAGAGLLGAGAGLLGAGLLGAGLLGAGAGWLPPGAGSGCGGPGAGSGCCARAGAAKRMSNKRAARAPLTVVVVRLFLRILSPGPRPVPARDAMSGGASGQALPT